MKITKNWRNEKTMHVYIPYKVMSKVIIFLINSNNRVGRTDKNKYINRNLKKTSIFRTIKLFDRSCTESKTGEVTEVEKRF